MKCIAFTHSARSFANPANRNSFIMTLFVFCVLALFNFNIPSAFAQESARASEFNEPTMPSEAEITSRIKELESNTNLSQDEKNKYKSLLNQSLADLNNIESLKKKQRELTSMQANAAEKLKSIEQQTNALKKTKGSNPSDFETLTIEEAQSELSKLEAQRMSLNHEMESLRGDLTNRTQVLAEMRENMTALRSQIDAQETNIARLTNDTSDLRFKRIRIWHLLTQKASFQAELDTLNIQAKVHPARHQLMAAELELKKQKKQKIESSLNVLQKVLVDKRIAMVEENLTTAEKATAQISNINETIKSYAETNEKMAKELTTLANTTQSRYHLRDQFKSQDSVLRREFQAVKMKIELMGLSQELGELLINQRNLLPDERLFQTDRQHIYDEISTITLRRLEVQNELGWRFDESEQREKLVQSLQSQPDDKSLQAIDELVSQRKDILKQLDESSDSYLTLLTEIDHNLSELITTVTEYKLYLKRNLIWIRIPYLASTDDENIFTQEWHNILTVAQAFSSYSYSDTRFLKITALNTLILFILLAAAAYSRQTRITTLKTLQLGSTNYAHVSRYLALLLLKIAPISFSAYLYTFYIKEIAFPNSLTVLAEKTWLYVLLCGFLYHLTKQNGFLSAFLNWPKIILTKAFLCAKILYWLACPTLLIAFIPLNVLENHGGGIIGSFLQVGCMIMFLYCTVTFLWQPYRILESINTHAIVEPASRTQRTFSALVIIFIVFWILCFLVGYRAAAAKICTATFETLILLVYAIIFHQIFGLWLRKVQVKEKVKLRSEEKELLDTETTTLSERDQVLNAQRIDEQTKNIEALGEESRKLVKLFSWLIGLGFVYMIWSPLLPAAAILDNIVLWTYETQIEGTTAYQTLTLAGLLIAFIVAALLLNAAKRLPPFLDMIVLSRLEVDNGTKYTVKTLISYILIAVAIIYTGNALGFSWSKIQWAVAALSVGIGFGLQEIVANFISGLIILFERPIRVGDLVTIGQHTGTVRKIRIRATTIVDFDNKELLVPNKEFITTALLNWTLSDREVRVLISVGVSYDSNVELALKLLEEIAKSHPLVLAEPAPVVTFESFGDSTLNLFLRCRIGSIDDRLQITTDLHKAISQRYRENGIEIAYPQRDLHIDSRTPLNVVLHRGHREQTKENHQEG